MESELKPTGVPALVNASHPATFPGQRVVYVTAELLVEFFTEDSEHHFRCTAGLPADAKPVRAFQKPPSGLVGEQPIVAVVYESAQWERLPNGAIIPELKAWFVQAECSRTKELRVELLASLGNEPILNTTPRT
jgi:hypothetical protein